MSGQYFEVESRRSHLTIDGIVLEFYDFGGCGSALLLVHGLAGGAHEWRATAKLLVSSHRVLAFDQRGHGFSSKPSGNYSRDAYVGDVIQVIEQLSLAPLVLIGQSMGGLNAMLVAARRPDLVRGLIMIEATPDRDPTVIGDIQVWLNKWPERFQTQEEALAFFGGSSPSSRAWVEGLEELDGGSGLCPRFRRDDMIESIADLTERDYWDDWSRIDCPGLVIVGSRGFVPAKVLEEMRRRRPFMRVVRVDNAGHDVHLDQPYYVAKMVQIFTSGLEGKAYEFRDKEITVRLIGKDDSIDALTELLHRAYRMLAEMGFNYTACDQSPEVTRQRIERGECYVATINDAIVATVTMYRPGRRTRSDWYNRKDTAHFGQFAVEPAFQSLGIGRRLLAHIENRARALGLSEIALDTAEGATDLVRFYAESGYRRVGRVRWDGKSYDSIIMSKTL